MAENCLELVRERITKEQLSNPALDKINEDLQELRNQGLDPATLSNEIKKYAIETQIERLEKRKMAVVNQLKEADNLAFIAQDAFKGDPVEAVKAILDGTSRIAAEGNRSIEHARQVNRDKLFNVLVHGLEEENLLELATSKTIDKEIAQELFELTTEGGKPGISGSTEALKIAKILQRVNAEMFSMLKNVDAPIREREGRVTRSTHDPELIRAADFDDWKADIMDNLHVAKTFKAFAKMPKEQNRILKEIYQEIIDGQYGTGSGGQRRRFFHFKDGESWFRYNEKYGRKGLMETIASDIEGVARSAAQIERLGINPEEQFESLLNKVETAIKRTGDQKKLREWQGSRKSLNDLWFTIKGLDQRKGYSLTAKGVDALNKVTDMAKMGPGVLNTFSDTITAAASSRATTGNNILQSTFESMRSFAEVTKDRKYWGKALGMFTEDLSGSFYSRMGISGDAAPGLLSRAHRNFFKLNLMSQQTQIANLAVARQHSLHLGKISKLSFAEVGEWSKANIFQRYGITPDDWDVIRQGTTLFKNDPDLKGITPESVAALPDEVFEQAIKKQGLVNINADKYRKRLSDSVGIFFSESIDKVAVPKGGARERALVTRGTDADDGLGQFLRLIGKYKNYPIAIFKTMERIGLSHPDQSAQRLGDLIRGKGDLSGLAQTIVGMTAMGYVGMVAKDLIANRTPRDPTSADTWIEAFVRGGAGGLYADYLFGEYQLNYRSLTRDILGPVLGQIDDVASLFATALRGVGPEDEGYLTRREAVLDKAWRLIKNNTPYNNLVWNQIAMNYLIIKNFFPDDWSKRVQRLEDRGQGLLFSQ